MDKGRNNSHPKRIRNKDFSKSNPSNRKCPIDNQQVNSEEQEETLDFVIGIHAVNELLQSTRDINKVFIQAGLESEKLDIIIGKARQQKLLVQFVPKAKLDDLSDRGVHQGVVATVAAYQYATIDDLFANAQTKNEDPFFLILDGIEDPHNLGSILRTADAVGAHGVFIGKHRAVGLTSVVAKTSTGAIEHVPVCRVTNMSQLITKLKERGVWIYGTDMKGRDMRQWDATLPLALVIGNEGKGISPLVKSQCDDLLTIPMRGHVQSLNASVAAAVLMYEVARKRFPI